MPLPAVHTALEPIEAVAILTFQMGNAELILRDRGGLGDCLSSLPAQLYVAYDREPQIPLYTQFVFYFRGVMSQDDLQREGRTLQSSSKVFDPAAPTRASCSTNPTTTLPTLCT